ncbi:hypothetical protein ACFWIB_36905 [Streptomyces sp. NPDC127051]|uniref:hypothetical protein n=1 Tax=Streptomyces sp. NPDC127051 TaxID=3347119 RepID=UPI003648D9BA
MKNSALVAALSMAALLVVTPAAKASAEEVCGGETSFFVAARYELSGPGINSRVGVFLNARDDAIDFVHKSDGGKFTWKFIGGILQTRIDGKDFHTVFKGCNPGDVHPGFMVLASDDGSTGPYFMTSVGSGTFSRRK